MKSFKSEFSGFIHALQNEICTAVEASDGEAKFIEDIWQRDGGGGGRTRVIANGHLFEKGGVNISEVHGLLPDPVIQYLDVRYPWFFACGISLVLHPFNPFVPTAHANFRYFELYDQEGNVVDLWFAGGTDLTPYYLYEEDAIHFHQVQKNVCDRFDTSYYPKFKEACDTYFRNHHRNEGRGIGGTFFDYLRPTEKTSGRHWFDFTTSLGKEFIHAYIPIIMRRKDTPFNAQHKHWQEIRRGRYVEFNLIHDKGTLFGLKTNGRVESILMSLPATVRWEYNVQPQPDTPESELVNVLVNPKNWIER